MSSVETVRERLTTPPARRVLRWGGPLVYGVALGLTLWVEGLPLSRDRLLMWILLGLLAFSLTNVSGWARSVVLEWIPFAIILWAYDLLRGQADGLFFDAHILPQLRVDEVMFGGTAPTVWLQEHLWDGFSQIHWYDYATWLVYVSYFLGTYVVAALLWWINRSLFRRYVVMVSVLALMGFTTYALFPAAPPWMASDEGRIEPITRIGHDLWASVGVTNFRTLYTEVAPNTVAAVPSLHAAYAIIVALFAFRLFGVRVGLLVSIHPLLVCVGIVYIGEHYAIDAIVGGLYAVGAYAVAWWLFRAGVDDAVAARVASWATAIRGRSREPASAPALRPLRTDAVREHDWETGAACVDEARV
jgi:membrane-associated phospholipid phosphatase